MSESPVPLMASRSARLEQRFLANIELWLSLAGLVLVFAVPAIVLRGSAGAGQNPDVAYWKTAGFTAILVGVVHGAIFWLVRRRQRFLREQTLNDVRFMLADVINSDLQVITLGLDRYPDLLEERHALAKVEAAIRRISGAVDTMSLEALQIWRNRYPSH